jgi:uncharacterized protein VirK/YbjX
LHASFPERILRKVLQGDVTLHQISNGINCYALTLGSPEPLGRLEGELSLDLRVDGEKIFTLSFTVVPGWVLRSEIAEILLITRLQGTLGARPQIRLARKTFREFFPGKLLLAALQGIADALGIDELQAVCSTRQRSYEKGCPAILRSAYDDLFAQMGMVETATGFYSSPIPIESKPLASMKRGKRSRARRRRAIRQQIQMTCAAFLSGAVDRGADFSSCTVCSSPIDERFTRATRPLDILRRNSAEFQDQAGHYEEK